MSLSMRARLRFPAFDAFMCRVVKIHRVVPVFNAAVPTVFRCVRPACGSVGS